MQFFKNENVHESCTHRSALLLSEPCNLRGNIFAAPAVVRNVNMCGTLRLFVVSSLASSEKMFCMFCVFNYQLDEHIKSEGDVALREAENASRAGFILLRSLLSRLGTFKNVVVGGGEGGEVFAPRTQDEVIYFRLKKELPTSLSYLLIFTHIIKDPRRGKREAK
jgi:hypothetical protein